MLLSASASTAIWVLAASNCSWEIAPCCWNSCNLANFCCSCASIAASSSEFCRAIVFKKSSAAFFCLWAWVSSLFICADSLFAAAAFTRSVFAFSVASMRAMSC
uniref:Secreted protein n=1 Tax=Salmonella phage vB_SE130_2P TaxID=3236707 RepID=A0AB39C533_9VIRU